MYQGKDWVGVNTDKLRAEGVEVVEGQTTEVEIRLRPKRKKEPLSLAEIEKRQLASKTAVAAIKQLGGWVQEERIDGWLQVVEVNMVYHQDEKLGRLENDLMTDECFSYLTKFPELKRLLLRGQQATDQGFAKITGLKNLELVCCWEATEITNDAAAHLAKIKSLREISIQSSKITDLAVGRFSTLPVLEKLSLQRSQLTNEALGSLRHARRLKELVLGLGENEFTDQGLVHLAGLTQLKRLGLQRSKEVTDAGLVHLRKLKNLEELWLSRSGVTQQGLDELCQYLPKLRTPK